MTKQILTSIILALGFLALPALALAVDLGSVKAPQFPQSEVIWQDRAFEVNGKPARAAHLRCFAAQEEILGYYAEALARQGWRIAHKIDYTGYNIFKFSKENQFLYVVVLIQRGKEDFDTYLFSSTQGLEFCPDLSAYLLQKKLAADTPGRDLSEIPRFQGSKRRLSILAQDMGAILNYEAEADSLDIASFYQKMLQMQGWKLTRSFGPEDAKRRKIPDEAKIGLRRLNFTKGKDSLTIYIRPLSLEPQLANRKLVMITRNLEGEIK